MNSDIKLNNEKLFYLPVTPKGERYMEAPGDSYLDGNLIAYDILNNYINRNYDKIESKVEIGGQLYTTSVYVPKKEYDFCYVLVNEKGSPIDYVSSALIKSETIQNYLNNIKNIVDKSDSIVPNQVISIRKQFIAPEFSSIFSGCIENDEQTISWERISDFAKVVLIGSPGSGKTTCLRRIALELSDSKNFSYRPRIIPIYVQLHYYNEGMFDINRIYNTYEEETGKELLDLAKSGEIILLFDGLDEVQRNNQNNIISSIKDICTRYPHIRVMVSVRDAAYNWEFPDFTHLYIKPFTISQIKEWTCQQIFPRKSWKTFFTHLTENSEILDMVKNPLMLVLAVSLYLQYSITPHNKANLINRYIHALIEDWDYARGVNKYDKIWASPQHKLFNLCYIAFKLNQTGKKSFSNEDLKLWKTNLIDETPSSETLRIISEDTGLINRLSDNNWTFIHECFLYYLSAEYLVESTKDLNSILKENISKKQWQNIWVYACTITNDASDLIEILLDNKRIRPLVKSNLIAEVLSQEIKANKHIIKKCSDFILENLEIFMKAFMLDRDKLHELIKETELKPIWSILALNNDKKYSLKSEDGIQLRDLLRTIYKARSSATSKMLFDKLSNSTSLLIRELALIRKVEGKFTADIKEANNEEYLFLSIIEESPKMADCISTCHRLLSSPTSNS